MRSTRLGSARLIWRGGLPWKKEDSELSIGERGVELRFRSRKLFMVFFTVKQIALIILANRRNVPSRHRVELLNVAKNEHDTMQIHLLEQPSSHAHGST